MLEVTHAAVSTQHGVAPNRVEPAACGSSSPLARRVLDISIMRAHRGPLRRCVSGDVFIEYALLVALFALPVSAACVRLGFPVLRMFRYAQLALAGPFP